MLDDRSKKSRAIFRHNGKILLCRKIKPMREYYFFPGGSPMDDETPEQAMRREIREELNCEVNNLKQLINFQNNFTEDGKEQNESITMFTGDLADDSVYSRSRGPVGDNDEIIAEWVSEDDIKSGRVRVMPIYDYLGLLD